jgi:cystathionine beta-lyase family protein involved in aluminum resistance
LEEEALENKLQAEYEALGISPKVIRYCSEIENTLKERFAEIDRIAEYNQMKVLAAMQKNRLSDVHFAATTGYGYNDMGRDTLEQVYADVFCAEDALVRPQLISGTHALTVALSGNLRPGDELLSLGGQALRYPGGSHRYHQDQGIPC